MSGHGSLSTAGNHNSGMMVDGRSMIATPGSMIANDGSMMATHESLIATPGTGQINMTLSYLGLGSPMPATAKFILPESAVKRMPLKKASFPSPIGSVFDVKGPPGLNMHPNHMHSVNASSNHSRTHMQALFSNPFTPGLELGLHTRPAAGLSPGASSFDALFARLTPHQQSMVSPSFGWDDMNSGILAPKPNPKSGNDENMPP